jgi:phosphoenolpyruvate phosphomutase
VAPIHSKAKTFEERAVAAAWDRSVPLVIVPTTFGRTSARECFDAGFKIVIFANYAIRSAITAMQQTLAQLRETGRIADAEDSIVPLKEVFRLAGVDQMNAPERAYLPVAGAVAAFAPEPALSAAP